MRVILDGTIYACAIASMSDEWKNEDDIKAELRTLTAELRQLREELSGMVEPKKPPSPTRAFLHRQSFRPRPGRKRGDDR